MWTQTLQAVISVSDKDEAKKIIELLVDEEKMQLVARIAKQGGGLLLTIKGTFTEDQISIIRFELLDLCEIEVVEETFSKITWS